MLMERLGREIDDTTDFVGPQDDGGFQEVSALLLGDVVFIEGFWRRGREESLTLALTDSHCDVCEEAGESEHDVLGGGSRPTFTVVRVSNERIVDLLGDKSEVLQGRFRNLVDEHMFTESSHGKRVLNVLILHEIQRFLFEICGEVGGASDIITLEVNEEDVNIGVSDEIFNNGDIGNILILLDELIGFSLWMENRRTSE